MAKRTEEQKRQRREDDKRKREQQGYYVYLLLNDEGHPHYVGMGRGERARISRYRHPLPDGRPAPSFILLKQNLSKKEAALLEKEFIHFHYGTIVNERLPGRKCGMGAWKRKER